MPPRQISAEEMCSLSPVRSLSAVFATLGRASPSRHDLWHPQPPSLPRQNARSEQAGSKRAPPPSCKREAEGKRDFLPGESEGWQRKREPKSIDVSLCVKGKWTEKAEVKRFSGPCRMSECRLLANRIGGGEGTFVSVWTVMKRKRERWTQQKRFPRKRDRGRKEAGWVCRQRKRRGGE